MYRNLNDYELLYMVCDSEDDSFSILMQKYQPLIYKISKEYSLIFKKFGYEISDLMQIGYMTLYKASSFYDVYNDTMFYTYLKKSINNAIIHDMRFNSTNKKEVLNNALSYDIEIPNGTLTYIDMFQDQKEFCNYSKELIIFKNSMPFNLAMVFELFYNGYTKNEISILLEEDIKNIKEMFNKIKIHALTYKSLFLK